MGGQGSGVVSTLAQRKKRNGIDGIQIGVLGNLGDRAVRGKVVGGRRCIDDFVRSFSKK